MDISAGLISVTVLERERERERLEIGREEGQREGEKEREKKKRERRGERERERERGGEKRERAGKRTDGHKHQQNVYRFIGPVKPFPRRLTPVSLFLQSLMLRLMTSDPLPPLTSLSELPCLLVTTRQNTESSYAELSKWA